MIVFGDASRQGSPRAELAALADGLGELAFIEAGLRRHERIVALFVDASEVAQGLADAEAERMGWDDDTPLTAAATSLLYALAQGLVRSWTSGFTDQRVDGSEPIDRLRDYDLPPGIIAKRAEGYAFYALYPEGYAEAARDLGGAPACRVVGLRSIGLGLACVVAAAAGLPRPVSVRPIGHPFARSLNTSDALAAAITGPPGTRLAIVDEGPGLTGSSFAAVIDFAEQRGVAQKRIELFPGHSGELGFQANDRNRARWRAMPKHLVGFEDLLVQTRRPEHRLKTWVADLLGEPVLELADISGGRWRTAHGIDEEDRPPADIQMERRKFLVRTPRRNWLAKFAGLGGYGEGKLKRAQALADAGFGANVRGARHGFLVEEWIAGTPFGLAAALDRRALLRRVADYLAFRVRTFPAPQGFGASLSQLADMAIHNAGEGLGPDAAHALAPLRHKAGELQHLVRRKATDNRMHAWEWLFTDTGRILKTDALDHCESHDLIGCQDITWDIAGAAIEFGFSPDEITELCHRIFAASGEKPDRLLLAYLAPCYVAFHLGSYTMAAAALSGVPEEASLLRRQTDRYSNVLRQRLGVSEPAAFT